MIVNNIVPNKERLHMKMNMGNSPNCNVCNVVEDNVHLFTECMYVREAWGWARLRLLSLLPDDSAQTSNFELLNLMFVRHVMDKEAVWLVGIVVEFICTEKIMRKRKVKLEHLIGHLKLKFKSNQFSKKPKLGYIIGICDYYFLFSL